ncbi:MAG: hypothetical protein R3F49_10015 [Planctomycetota bacterium]
MLSLVRPAAAVTALSLVAAFGAAGCATYNERVSVPLGQFESGDFAAAQAGFTNPKVVGSGFLRGAEGGMAAFVGGDWETAKDRFHAALDAVKDIEERAAIGVESVGEGLLSFALNEGQQSYDGEGYERVMAHACLGLAYLALGQVDSVLVEARRVDQLLVAEEALYETEYGAGGLGHFLSALAYELVGKPGEAYIDYQRMAEKGVGGDLTSRALVRLSSQLGRKRDLARWIETYGPDLERPEGAASIVLVGGAGMGPAKREIKIDIPLPDGVFSWAVPEAVAGDGGGELSLFFPATGQRLRASVIEDVSSVAAKNLSDRILWLSAKSAIRGLLKRQLADQLRDNKKGGALLGLAADIFTIATERADLRAWRTLPSNWQAARAFVTPGEPVEVQVGVTGGAAVPLGTFQLTAGETMFVFARSLRGRTYAHAVGGARVDAP